MNLLLEDLGGNHRQPGGIEANGKKIFGYATIAQLQPASRIDGDAVPANVADWKSVLVESGAADPRSRRR